MLFRKRSTLHDKRSGEMGESELKGETRDKARHHDEEGTRAEDTRLKAETAQGEAPAAGSLGRQSELTELAWVSHTVRPRDGKEASPLSSWGVGPSWGWEHGRCSRECWGESGQDGGHGLTACVRLWPGRAPAR